MLRLTDEAYNRLREKHLVLAEVIDSDRALDAMRHTNVIDLATVKLRRERVQVAARNYGFSIRGDGSERA